MKKLLTVFFLMATCSLFAQNQIFNFYFSPHSNIVDADGFSAVSIDNCTAFGEEGAPELPFFSATFLLSPGEEIKTATVTHVEYYPVVENITIRPMAGNFPVSQGAPEGYKAMPNPQIYSVNADYPAQIVNPNQVATSFLRGHALGSFLICPVVYNPVEKTARFVKNITIEVNTESTQRASTALRFLRCDQTTTDRVKNITGQANMAVMSEYYKRTAPKNNPNYDFLIVTTSQFDGAFDDLIAHKQNWGYKVAIKFVEDIYNEYDGRDDAEKVRNCIIDYYLNEGISYVMLVGDSHNNNATHNKIPLRRFYSTMNNSSVYDHYLASDMYFACLDGDWNSNGNNNWGEPNDDCDLSHEIGVGRLCADNVNEIKTFVDKLILYQSEPVVDDIKKILLVGEKLDDNPTYGGTAKDIVVAGGNFYGMMLQGIPSDFILTRLYEKNENWGASDLYNQFNTNGVHIINHLGHSDVNFNMNLYNNNVTTTNITNDGITRGFAIGYSQGCYNGSFDNRGSYGNTENYDCINEMHMKLPTGMIANIGNSRFGWYSTNNAGPSQAFDRTFFHSIFGKGIFNIGDANSSSKDLLSGYVVNDEYLRWCCYELNLMGDPSMDIWTDTPAEFTPTFPEFVTMADAYINVETAVASARIALFQDGKLIGRGVCDENGDAIATFDQQLDPTKLITISITGHNMLRYESTIEVVGDMPVEELTGDADGLNVSLSWSAPKNSMPASYQILRDDVLIATLPVSKHTYEEIAPEEKITYNYCVIAVYPDYSIPSCVEITTGLFCETIADLNYTTTASSIELQWVVPTPIEPNQYEIYRDGAMISSVSGDVITYTDEDVTAGEEYEYCIVARYDECKSDIQCEIIKLVLGINDTQTNIFTVFPNPAQDHLTVSGASMQHITIYNIIGKMLYETTVENLTNITIPISQFENGMYLLQIRSEGKISTKQFVIRK